MPRIAAKTVKEHRENIETALVDAAAVSYTHLTLPTTF